MNPKSIVLLGVKRTVVAYQKETGERLWSQQLAAGMGNDFVTVIADESKVYAHSLGAMYCLDLFTGQVLWKDGLAGFGYGIASLALPGGSASTPPPAGARKRQEDSEAAATNASVG